MKNFLAQYNLVAVSANAKETAINTEQTLDTCMLVASGDVLLLDPRRESNANELTGKEEPDAIYNLGAFSNLTMNFEKAQAQHFGFGLSYGLGTRSVSSWGGGYKHVATPTSDMTLPPFTAAQRLGSTIQKMRCASMYIDQLTATFVKDSWAKLVLGTKGTGKNATNMTKESITAAYNASSLTLAANAVQGGTAAARLDNVHLVRCQVPSTNQWLDVVVTAVSSATPAVLTITPPGGAATSITYEVIYVPTEPAWATFPARVTEPPLRVTDLVVKIGGLWNGSAFLGGHSMSEEIESIEYVLNNNLAIEFRPGGTGSYANYAYRQGRAQVLKLNRQMRDYIMQQHLADNDTFGCYLKATGSEFESGKNYYVELVFPKCGVLTRPISVSGKFLGEAGDILVMEDDTYGSVRAEIANMVSAYAA